MEAGVLDDAASLTTQGAAGNLVGPPLRQTCMWTMEFVAVSGWPDAEPLAGMGSRTMCERSRPSASAKGAWARRRSRRS